MDGLRRADAQRTTAPAESLSSHAGRRRVPGRGGVAMPPVLLLSTRTDMSSALLEFW